MTEVNKNGGDESTQVFNTLSFERKLVELVEELRLRRDLELEGEKTLKSIMDEKYEEELSWEKQQRRHAREKEDLDQQIELLKRKLEDKVCVSDDDKAKQQIMNKTYSHEIRILKEDLRASKSEKLNLQKKIQELEGKLRLHKNFQDSIMTQMADVRKMIKSVIEESQQLAAAQKSVMENVASAKATFRKYDLCNQHLQQSLSIVGKKSEILKKELISTRSELVMLKQSVKATQEEKPKHDNEVEKLQQKILELENLFLLSRKENEKAHKNFLESNKVLCKVMDTYAEAQEREKRLTQERESLQDKLYATEKKLRETEDKMKNNEEMARKREKAKTENQVSIEVQTESNFEDRRLLSSRKGSEIRPAPSALSSLEPDGMCGDFMNKIRSGLMDLQQSTVVMQSESYVKNRGQDVTTGCLSSNKKITVSEILKRKLEILESGDSIELISMKKRFSQDSTLPSSYDINTGQNKGLQNGVQLSAEENNAPPLCSINTGQNGVQISCEKSNAQPLYNIGFQNGVQLLAEKYNALQFYNINPAQNEGFQNGVQILAEENNAPKLYSIITDQNEDSQNGMQISAENRCVDIKADDSKSAKLSTALPIDHRFLGEKAEEESS